MNVRLKRASAVLVLLFACCASSAGVLVGQKIRDTMLERANGARQKHLEELDKYTPRFEDDQRALAGLTELNAPWHSEDASPVLGPLVPWEGEQSQAAIDRFVAEHGAPRLALSPEIRHALQGRLEEAPVLDGLALPDLEWMTTLNRFDHWNLWANSPLPDAEPKSGADLELLVARPLPEFRQFNWAARLRLERASDGELAAAAEQVHHLAVLLWRTDSLPGELIAVSIFEIERRVLSRRGAMDRAHPYDAETIHRLKRVAWAALAYANQWTPETMREKHTGPGTLGACAGIREASMMYILSRPMVGDRYPEAYGWLDAQLDGGSCDLSDLQTFWKLTRDGMPDGYCDYLSRGAAEPRHDGGGEPGGFMPPALICLAPMRAPMGETLLALGSVRGFKEYDVDGGR